MGSPATSPAPVPPPGAPQWGRMNPPRDLGWGQHRGAAPAVRAQLYPQMPSCPGDPPASPAAGERSRQSNAVPRAVTVDVQEILGHHRGTAVDGFGGAVEDPTCKESESRRSLAERTSRGGRTSLVQSPRSRQLPAPRPPGRVSICSRSPRRVGAFGGYPAPWATAFS